MNLRDLFNERKWHQADLQALQIVARHRGAPNDERTISGFDVKRIAPGGLFLDAAVGLGSEDEEDSDDGEVFLPFHRVLEVRGPNGVIWTRDP